MAADKVCSTTQIIRYVDAEKPGTHIAIGTEINLVKRLARQHPDKNIVCLAESGTRCVQMAKIDLPHLLWSLDSIAACSPVNVISVPDGIALKARDVLERMINL
jgi:quinolinate synthase